MNTRRFPRSLSEAFGPYADRSPVHPMRDNRPMDHADKIVVNACLIAGAILALLCLLGVIA